MRNKGQMNNSIVASMIILLIVGFLGIISLTVYDSIEGSLSSSLSTSTGDAAQTVGNFTENFYDGQDLVSNLPIVIAAGLLISVIVGFTLYLRS